MVNILVGIKYELLRSTLLQNIDKQWAKIRKVRKIIYV